MSGKDTKALILETALRLFSDRGYDGVSIRDIAREVGVRESALYKHFKSKREIFDSLLDQLKRHYDETVIELNLPYGEIQNIAQQYGAAGLSTLKHISREMFLFWLKDDYAARFRRLLTIEQFKNGEASAVYHNFFMDEALTFQRQLFAAMIEAGYFCSGDPEVMALQFYSPFFLLFNMYDSRPEKEEEALRILDGHVAQFAAQYAPKLT